MEAAEEPATGNQEEKDIGFAADEAKWANAAQSSYQAFDEVALDWTILDEYEVKPNIEYEMMIEGFHYSISGENVIKINGVV